MKKFNAKMIPALLVALFFSANLMAQETVLTVKVEKDGKVVKDTAYLFEDEAQAEHALKMMDILCADDEHMMEIHKTMSENHGEHTKTMIFISEDGETKEIKEIHGDSLVWIAEGEHEDDQVKVMKYRVEDGDCGGEQGNKKIVKTKVIKMTVEGDEEIKKSKKQ